MEELIFESNRSRVIRRAGPDGPVILKILNRVNPSVIELARFRQEYQMTASLIDIPGVIRCRRLLRLQDSLALELEDIGGISLDRILSDSPLPVVTFLDLAAKLAGILARVHAAGVVHRDINPSNIVWNAQSGELQLIDFGIADRIPEEMAEAVPPALLEGSLFYLAPEQTGRTNRPVDSRSDLYSLGATFHYLLMGRPPFSSPNPSSLIADHLAKRPQALERPNSGIPGVLSSVVLKLLAKEPEDRYQSARSLEADLNRCIQSISPAGEIPPFQLGLGGGIGRLRFSARLHGREKELRILVDALDRVKVCGRRLLLLSGGAGTGKTALGRELRKPVAQALGRFSRGKFDQLRRDRPLAAMVDVLRDLLRQRQADSQDIFEKWRSRVRNEVGASLVTLSEQIPEIGKIFGDMPLLPELPASQAADRFERAAVGLIRTLADEGFPLVLFLDDLQWADQPFLDLVGRIMTDPKTERLLIVGAFRNGEVPPSHPLAVAIQRWGETGLPITRLPLGPLPLEATLSFLSESLSRPGNEIIPLAQILQEKSSGNPFFLRTLLSECREREWISIESDRWIWKLDMIREGLLPETILPLLLERLERLPESSRLLLATAASLGHVFDLESLAVASGESPPEVALKAESLLNTGYWVPGRGDRRLARWMDEPQESVSYRFVHDRVQEASLELVPPGGRNRFRLGLGNRLLSAFPDCEKGDRLFLVAEQFVGIPGIHVEDGDRKSVTRVLLAAGRRAKGAVAFSIGLRYLEAGMEVLGEDGWERDYSLALALRHEAANCAGAMGDIGSLERLRREVSDHTSSLKDQLPVLAPLPMLYLSKFMVKEMKVLGIWILTQLDYRFPVAGISKKRQLSETRKALAEAFRGIGAGELADLPKATDPDFLFLARWLPSVFIGLYFGIPSLLLHFTVSMSLRIRKDGLVDEAPWYFTWVSANLLGSLDEAEVDCGRRLGEASRLLLESGEAAKHTPWSTIHIFNVLVRPWQEPLGQCCSHLTDQYSRAMSDGDSVYAGWALTAYLLYLFELGGPLDEAITLYNNWIPSLEGTGQMQLPMLVRDCCLNPFLELQGRGDSTWRIGDDLPREIVENRELLCFHYAHAGITAFLFREHSQALPMIQRAVGMFEENGGCRFSLAVLVVLESLCLLGEVHGRKGDEPRWLLTSLERNRKHLQIWAKGNPENFRHLELLVEAAWQRAMGFPEKALGLCEEAVSQIRSQSGEVWMQYEALSLELQGECLLEMGLDALARDALRRAVCAWSRFGATALVRERESRYGELVAGWSRRLTPGGGSHLSDPTEAPEASALLVDYPSLLEASQAIASETSHPGVVKRLVSLTLANAGAERAFLFLPGDGEWTLACTGEYASGEITLRDDSRPDDAWIKKFLPFVRYAGRSQEATVLDDAGSDPRWPELEVGPCSILCAPLLHLGRIIGVLLLVNTSRGFFSRDRVEMVSILGARAAISLTNSRMMDELQFLLKQVRSLGAHLDQSSETEKRKIAGEIHDELGSTLTAAKISLFMLEKRQREEEDRARCREISGMVDNALITMKRISHSLRPDMLDKVGLFAALEDLVRSVRQNSGLTCRLDAERTTFPLSDEQRISLFRIAQEAVTNALRHARAGSIIISLREESGQMILDVRDDGRGITTEEARDIRSFGLVGMRERAERLEGGLHVGPLPDGGTLVTARIPISKDGPPS